MDAPHPSDTLQVNLSREELRSAMRTDCVLFLSFYLQDELTLEVPELHEEIWDEMVDIIKRVSLKTFRGVIRKLFCVPRGHAKSTITKLAIILFFRYSPLRFALYASLTASIAKSACRDIVNWLQTPHDNEVFGLTRVLKSNESDQLWILEIGTPEYGRKVVLLKALGADQQVRGTLVDNKRPELLVIDDCEDRDTARDDKTQRALDEWLMGALLKATARNCVHIMLGNMINKRTALYRFSKDPDWNPTVYGAIIRDKRDGKLKPLWEGLYTLDELLADYKKYRLNGTGYIWVYEMMNMTLDTVFKVSMEGAYLIPRPNPDELTAGVITIDPAYGLSNLSNHTAIAVHAMVKGQSVPILVETRKIKVSEDKLYEVLTELSYYWNIATWAIESEAAQRLYIPFFKTKMLLERLNPNLFCFIPLMSGRKSKNSRILAFVNSVGQGNYGIAQEEEQLLYELANFDAMSESSDDDLPDAAAYGIIVWETNGQIIRENGMLRQRMTLLTNDYDTADTPQLNRARF